MKRILILSASAGAGHLRAAQALEAAFRPLDSDLEIRHEDTLRFANFAFRNIYSKTYINMVNTHPGILGLLYDLADEPWKGEKRRIALDRMQLTRLVRMIHRYKPDLVVATHFLPAEIISSLLCQRRINTRLAVVITDMDVHSMWLCRHYHKYFVALEEARVHMTMLGFDPERVIVTGIPIDPVFSVPKCKTEARRRLGLDLEKPVIYLSTGGFGVGKAEEILAALCHMETPVQVLAMCGRNELLKASLSSDERLNSGGPVRVVPVGFTTEVDEYMAASDLVLGKPGGLTTSEALARDLSFVVVNPIPGQEERNSDHLLEEGVAIRCNNLPSLSYKVDALLREPRRLALMSENVSRIKRPEAAIHIARNLLEEDDLPGRLSGNAWKSGHVCRRSPVPKIPGIPIKGLNSARQSQ